MAQQRHIIKQQILELHLSSDANAFELQNQISAIYRSEVLPQIEAICNQLSDPDTIHRIDRLEIDLGEIGIEALETDFVQKAAELLFEQLSQILAATTLQPTESIQPTLSIEQTQQASPTGQDQARFELLREFLQNGRLPWWSKPLNRNDLEKCFNQLLADSPDKLRVLLQSSLKQEKILQRILYQFSEQMQMELLKLLAPFLHSAFCIYLEDIQRLIPYIEPFQKFDSQRLRQTIWQGLFLYLSLQQPSSYPSTKPEIDAVLRANLLHIGTQLNLDGRSLTQQLLTTLKKLNETEIHFASDLIYLLEHLAIDLENVEAKSSMTSVRVSSPEALLNELLTIEDIYLQNAGIVLLWPFLKGFFETLNLVESGQFLSLQTAHRAILFLQYLVDESLESLEPSLSLNKILCGLDLSEPIPTTLVITEDEQNECEALLTSTIHNWSAVGTISISGLRQAFLQRAGILRAHREGWLLQVEHQTHDILLDCLPWSVRVVKLPWMEQVLHVEW